MAIDEKARARAAAFMQDVAAKIADPAKRAAFLAAQEEAGALEVLAGGVLRQDEFSRGMTEAQKLRKENEDWLKTQKGYLDEFARIKPEYEKLKAQPSAQPGAQPPAFDPATLDGRFVTPAAHAQALQELANRLAGLTVATAKYTADYQTRFGKPLDVEAFWQQVATTQRPPEVVYAEFTAPLQKERDEAAVAARVEEEVKKRLAAQPGASQLPHPGQFMEPGPVMDFTKDPDKTEYGVDAAVREWMQSRQAGAGTA